MRIAVNSDQLVSAIVYSTVYLLAILVIVATFIPFKLRAGIGLILFYITGVTSLVTLGPAGSGRLYLIMFAVLTTLLLGFRAGLAALLLDIGTIFIWSWAVVKNLNGFSLEMTHQHIQWNGIRWSFLFVNAVITLSLGVLVSVLEKKNLQGAVPLK